MRRSGFAACSTRPQSPGCRSAKSPRNSAAVLANDERARARRNGLTYRALLSVSDSVSGRLRPGGFPLENALRGSDPQKKKRAATRLIPPQGGAAGARARRHSRCGRTCVAIRQGTAPARRCPWRGDCRADPSARSRRRATTRPPLNESAPANSFRPRAGRPARARVGIVGAAGRRRDSARHRSRTPMPVARRLPGGSQREITTPRNNPTPLERKAHPRTHSAPGRGGWRARA